MATKILAVPVDDKRKASVVTLSFDSAGDSDIVDIRGFANFTLFVTVALGGSETITIKVNDSADTTPANWSSLYALGTTNSGTIMGTIPEIALRAYDLPELAGCHYVQFQKSANTTTGTVKLMGKV